MISRRKLSALFGVLTCASVAVGINGLTASARYDAGAATSSATSVGPVGYGADAYGSRAVVLGIVKSGATAVSALGCTSTAGLERANTLATLNVPDLVNTGVLNTTASTTATPSASASADVVNVNLLDGLITAQDVKSVSTTSEDATGFHVSAAGSQFLNLVIGGVPITGSPAPNTTISLLGVGKVVLNEQITSIKNHQASFTVNQIHVYATALSTELVVSHASSSLKQSPPEAFMDGHAYATSARVLGGLLVSGETAAVNVGCEGTDGKVRTNSVAGVTIPSILSSGTLTSTAQGTVTTTTVTSATTSTIQAINLLSGLITADLISAHATAHDVSGTDTFSDSGSNLVNLTIGGNSYPASTPANTKLTLGALTIWIHRVIHSSSNIEVRMLEIVVNSATNPFGLAVNTDIRVAVAEASIEH